MAYRIKFTHENDKVSIKINNIWENGFWCSWKTVLKKTFILTFKPKFFILIEWQFCFQDYEVSDFETIKVPNFWFLEAYGLFL